MFWKEVIEADIWDKNMAVIKETRLNVRRNALDSKVYFESNTEKEEPKETTIEDIDPSVAEAYQKKEMDEWSEEKIFDHQLQLWEDTADREFDAMTERTD